AEEFALDPDSHLHATGFDDAFWSIAYTPSEHTKLSSLENLPVSDDDPLLCTLRRHPEVTAILAPNDASAVIVHHILKHAGLRVPDDISLIGFDGTIPLCNAEWRNILTTVALPLHQIGFTAATRITDRVTGALTHDVHDVLPTSLVIRETTAPPRSR
ncbi:MAG TPA: substrate-binding domain-containing protein, partial [Armatimonadota bacterium]